MNVCVYCASSRTIDGVHHLVAATMGELIANQNHTLVYGGGSVGLMGTLARSVHAHGGRVIGVIPKALQKIEGRAYDIADELVITDTMQERKQIMFSRADGFAVLPGGIGTLEEFFEVLTLRKLGYHSNPIAIVNANGFFDPLLALLDHIDQTNFSPKITDGALYHVADTPLAALTHLSEFKSA